MHSFIQEICGGHPKPARHRGRGQKGAKATKSLPSRSLLPVGEASVSHITTLTNVTVTRAEIDVERLPRGGTLDPKSAG